MKKCLIFLLIMLSFSCLLSFAEGEVAEPVNVLAKQDVVEVFDGVANFGEDCFYYDLSRYINVADDMAAITYVCDDEVRNCKVSILGNVMEIRPLEPLSGNLQVQVLSNDVPMCSFALQVKYVNMNQWLGSVLCMVFVWCVITLVLVSVLCFCRPYKGAIMIKPDDAPDCDIVISPIGIFPIPGFLVNHQALNQKGNMTSQERNKRTEYWASHKIKGCIFSKSGGICICSASGIKENGRCTYKVYINQGKSKRLCFVEENLCIEIGYF